MHVRLVFLFEMCRDKHPNKFPSQCIPVTRTWKLTPRIEQTLIHLVQDLARTIAAASCRPSGICDRNESPTTTNRPGLYLLVVLGPVWDFASRVAVLAVVYSFVVLSDHCFSTPCFFHYSSADFSGLTAISVV